MAEPYPITFEPSADPGDIARVRQGLSAYNSAHACDDSFTPLTLFVRDPDGQVVGGLLGGTYWGWLVVEVLWIDESARRLGLGSRLLVHAEQIALERGCHAAHLDTMSFQAPAFYEQHGYKVFGILDDLPKGHRRIFFYKELKPDLS